jgi:exodeoxyribonuclease VII small subunit
MVKSGTKPIDELSYEQAFAELDEVLTSLEAGDRPLEEALSLFERGQNLVKICAGLLTQAELRVNVLSGEKLDVLQEDE